MDERGHLRAKARDIRQEQMAPEQRAEYLDGILNKKLQSQQESAQAIEDAENEIAEKQKELKVLKDQAMQIDKEVSKLRSDLEAAVHEKAEQDRQKDRSSRNTATPIRAANKAELRVQQNNQRSFDKTTFREWIKVQSAEAYQMFSDMQWQAGTYHGQWTRGFDRWEANHNRVRKAIAVAKAKKASDWNEEEREIIAAGDEAARTMFHAEKPYFPDDADMVWIKAELIKENTAPIRSMPKRYAEDDSESPEKKIPRTDEAAVEITGPFIINDTIPIPLIIDDTEEEVDEDKARRIYLSFLTSVSRSAEKDKLPNHMDDIPEIERLQLRDFYRAILQIIEKNAKEEASNGKSHEERAKERLQQLPTYETYLRSLAAGKYAPQ